MADVAAELPPPLEDPPRDAERLGIASGREVGPLFQDLDRVTVPRRREVEVFRSRQGVQLTELQHEVGVSLGVVGSASQHAACVRDLVPAEQRLRERNGVAERQCAAAKVGLRLDDLGWEGSPGHYATATPSSSRSTSSAHAIVSPRSSRASRIRREVVRGALGLPRLAHRGHRRGQGAGGGLLVAPDHGQLQQRGVVPVVLLAACHPALDRVPHDREELLDARVLRVADLEQRDGVDPRIRVPPVRLEPLRVRVDRPLEQPARQHPAAVLLRRQPAVLVDAAEDPVGLAARTSTLDQVEQLSLSALAFTRPVQRERELLADHGGRRERRRHLLDELDHLRPRLHRAIGEEEVDHDLRLGVLDRAEIGFDGPHRLHALAAGLRQLLPCAPRSSAPDRGTRRFWRGRSAASAARRSARRAGCPSRGRALLRAVARVHGASRRHPGRPAGRVAYGRPAAGRRRTAAGHPPRRSARCCRAAARVARRARRRRSGSRWSGRRRRTRRAAAARTSPCG